MYKHNMNIRDKIITKIVIKCLFKYHFSFINIPERW